jgi:hypothetical protein
MAVVMAHRDCILRHGFLPAQIYHDWGSEFYNTFVPPMVGLFGGGYERRPAGAARFGGLGESLNAHFSAFLQTLAGGTYFDKAGRSADGRSKSRATAALDIPAIIRAGDNWLFKTWSETPIGREKLSPNERFDELYKCFPTAFASAQDSLLARYHTSVPLKGKKFDYTRGYRCADTRFGADALAVMLNNGEKPTGPRLDCMDPSLVIVMTKGGPMTLRDLDMDRINGYDLAQRMAEFASLSSYSSTAKRNQALRNAREAKDRRDAKKVAGALGTHGENGATNEGSDQREEASQLLDFSASLAKPIQKLERLD